ncbi:MAG: hypothetical protein ACOH2F_05040 [Cellulomonas sp.]
MSTERTTAQRHTGDAPVYDNESFWWSTPVRENYLGLDRGPAPTLAAVADGSARPADRRRRELPTRWAAQSAVW